MAYVYKHIRKDNNQPFYIGVGGLISFDNYQRANGSNWKGLHNRSNFWKNVVDKYGFIVEIVLDNCTKKEAFNKEVELIKLYGRQDINTGILVNHTDGGDGRINSSDKIKKKCGIKNIGRKASEETKQKLSKVQRGKKLSKEHKEKIANAHRGKPKNYRNNTAKYVIDTSSGKIYESGAYLARLIGMKYATLRAMLSGTNPNKTNYKYL